MRISDWSSDVCSSDLLAKKRPERMTPARTPCARSCVQTTITTVTIITTEDCHGWYRMSLIERHEKVPIETMIMTATSEAIGMIATSGPSTSNRNSRKTPDTKVESRVSPPDFTLMTA